MSCLIPKLFNAYDRNVMRIALEDRNGGVSKTARDFIVGEEEKRGRKLDWSPGKPCSRLGYQPGQDPSHGNK